MECGGASLKILICDSRPRRITERKSVHRRVWNTLGCFQDSSEYMDVVRMFGSKLVNLIVGGISPHTEDAESCGFFYSAELGRKMI